MSSDFMIYVMMINQDRIITISKDVNNTDYFLPGGNLYLDESWTDGAVRIVKSQIGVRVRKKDLIFLHGGVINQVNTITYLLYKWRGKMNIDYLGCLILENTPELLQTIHSFTEHEDDYFKIIVDKYRQYLEDKKKSKTCLIL